MDHFNEEEKVVPTLWCSLFDESSKTCRRYCSSISNPARPETPREDVARILAIGHDRDRTIKCRKELTANALRCLAWVRAT